MSQDPKFFERQAMATAALAGTDDVTARALAKTADEERKRALRAERNRRYRDAKRNETPSQVPSQASSSVSRVPSHGAPRCVSGTVSERLTASQVPSHGAPRCVSGTVSGTVSERLTASQVPSRETLARVSEIKISLSSSDKSKKEEIYLRNAREAPSRETVPETVEKMTQQPRPLRGWSSLSASSERVKMGLDTELPKEFRDACMIAGYSSELIADQWPRFRAHRIEKGDSSTVEGFCASFRDRWLRDAKKYLALAKEQLSEEDKVAVERQRILRRESDRLHRMQQEAEHDRALEIPVEVRAKLADIFPEGLETKTETIETRIAKMHGVPKGGIPGDRAGETRYSDLEAELAAELAKLTRIDEEVG